MFLLLFWHGIWSSHIIISLNGSSCNRCSSSNNIIQPEFDHNAATYPARLLVCLSIAFCIFRAASFLFFCCIFGVHLLISSFILSHCSTFCHYFYWCFLIYSLAGCLAWHFVGKHFKSKLMWLFTPFDGVNGLSSPFARLSVYTSFKWHEVFVAKHNNFFVWRSNNQGRHLIVHCIVPE